MTTNRADLALERLLLGIEDELFEASDVEVLAAAAELGIKPRMKGSIALIGITKLVPEERPSSRDRKPLHDDARPGRRSPKGDASARD
jgi:hypothetical protein